MIVIKYCSSFVTAFFVWPTEYPAVTSRQWQGYKSVHEWNSDYVHQNCTDDYTLSGKDIAVGAMASQNRF